MTQINYLLLGHATADVAPDGLTLGGTVSYAGRTASALGYQTAVVTSAPPAWNLSARLPGLSVVAVPSVEMTTFTNDYTPTGRVQTLHAVAETLLAEHVPLSWRSADIVHLAPLNQEFDPDLIMLFPDSIIGITPQGWLRSWDVNGRISPCDWPAAAKILPQATVVILSEHDLVDDSMLTRFRHLAPLLVLTRGARGCIVYEGDEGRDIPVTPQPEVNPTGAGDVFAGAFLVRLHQTGGDPYEAAAFANNVAAATVGAATLDDKVAQIKNRQAFEFNV